MNKIVFVYGTLKRGYGNNRILKNAEFLGEAKTCEDSYLMFDCGFPYVVRGGKFHVKGELYLVNDSQTAKELDWLEGYPDHYDRVPVTVCDGDNHIEAEMYVASKSTEGYARTLQPIMPNDNNILEWGK